MTKIFEGLTDEEEVEYNSLLEELENQELFNIESFARLQKLTLHIRDEESQNEVFNAQLLIRSNCAPSNIFNTFEWVNNCFERIEDFTVQSIIEDKMDSHLEDIDEDLTPYQPMPGLHICDDYFLGQETYTKFKTVHDDTPRIQDLLDSIEDKAYPENMAYLSPVELAIAMIRRGVTPDPALLLSLSNCFDLYFNSGGELSLEDVFFGKHKKNDIKANKRIDTFKGISFLEFHQSVIREEGKSLEDLAIKFIQIQKLNHPESKLIPEHAQAFIKKYRRWKSSAY